MNTQRLVENISDQELKIYDSLNIIREGNIRETHGDKSYDFVRGVKMRSDVSSIAEERNREKENGGGLERRVGGRGSKVEPATCCTIDQKSRMKGD